MALTSLYNTALRALKKGRKVKNQNLESSSKLGRSSHGDEAARLGHPEMSEALSQEATPDTNQSPSKKRKKKSTRAKKERKVKNQNLESSSKLGRSSHGDEAARLGHPNVPETSSQETTPFNNQSPSAQNDKNPTSPEGLTTKIALGRTTLQNIRQRPKVFKKIKKCLKRFGKKLSKKFEKKIAAFLLGAALSVVGTPSTSTIISDAPMGQQIQIQVINNMYCSVSESASPVAVTPQQPVLQADNQPIQVY